MTQLFQRISDSVEKMQYIFWPDENLRIMNWIWSYSVWLYNNLEICNFIRFQTKNVPDKFMPNRQAISPPFVIIQRKVILQHNSSNCDCYFRQESRSISYQNETKSKNRFSDLAQNFLVSFPRWSSEGESSSFWL